MAHEFNNALGVVLGYLELARSTLSVGDDRTRECLNRALATLERAVVMADRLFTPPHLRDPHPESAGH